MPPLVKAVTPENEKKLAEFDAKIAALNKQLTDHIASIGPHREAWLAAISKQSAAKRARRGRSHTCRRMQAQRPMSAVTNGVVASDAKSAVPAWQDELFGQAAIFDGKQHLDYPLDFPMADKPFSWAVWVKPTGAGAILSRMDSARRSRGCDLFLFADRKVGMHIIADWPSNAMKVLTSRPAGC